MTCCLLHGLGPSSRPDLLTFPGDSHCAATDGCTGKRAAGAGSAPPPPSREGRHIEHHFEDRLSFWLLSAEGCGANRCVPGLRARLRGACRGVTMGGCTGWGCPQGSPWAALPHLGAACSHLRRGLPNQWGHFADWLGVRVTLFGDAPPAAQPDLTQKAGSPGGSRCWVTGRPAGVTATAGRGCVLQQNRSSPRVGQREKTRGFFCPTNVYKILFTRYRCFSGEN